MGKENDSKKSDKVRLVPFPSTIPIVIVALSILLGGLLYIVVVNLAPTGEENRDPCALMTTIVSSTQARVSFEYGGLPGPGFPHCRTDLFEKLFEEAWPLALRIVLSNDSHSGIYTFQSFEDGALVLKSGDDMGNITYWDLMDNNKLNSGDALRLEDLGRESYYRLDIVWDPTNEVIAMAVFATP